MSTQATSVEAVAGYPRLEALTQRFTLGTPRSFTVAPDGSRVLFLRSLSGMDKRHALYSLDVASGTERCLVDPSALVVEEELSTQERAARERTRTRSAGVVAFSCDERVAVAVFSLSGSLYVVDVADGAVSPLPTAPAAVDPRIDPTGRRVAYVGDGALRVVEIDGSDDRVVVAPAEDEREHVTWGLAEFVAAEEMDRGRGFWWSPDGERLLAARVDTSDVPVWHIGDPADPATAPRAVAYPAAGQCNADVRLSVFHIGQSHTGEHDGRAIEWDREAFPYLVSVRWSSHGPPLLTVQSRDQRTQPILSADLDTGVTTTLHTETDEYWVDVYTGVPAWTPGGGLLHAGVRDGAYRLLVDGADVSGDGLQLRLVISVGADGVLFTASEADPTQLHVYFLAHGENKPVRVSESDGVHSGVTAGGVTVLSSWSLAHAGPKVTVRRDGREIATLDSVHEEPPFTPDAELLTVGERGLRCALLLPSQHRAGTPLPVIMEPYGGPHAQRVLSTRSAYLTHRWLAEQGFAVLIVDGRGTAGRGPAWDRAVHHDFAGATLADQVDALHAVAERVTDLDLSRVAIRGWSYGGYLAALAVLRRPDVFHAAIAGAPVTDWQLYDTFYTERYLGLPQENPETYERNSLLTDASKLSRPLLLIHGLADDNVFSAHTLRLSAALLAAGRRHDVWPLTGVTHMLPADGDMAANFPLVQLDWLRTALGIACEDQRVSSVRVTVVGAGIVGLACALRLVEAGHRVRIRATATGEATTSSVAAAIWYPYGVGHGEAPLRVAAGDGRAFPRDRVLGWGARGREVLASMADDADSGVRLRSGRQLFRAPTEDPWWISAVPGVSRVRGADLPAGYADGLRLSVPVVDMSRHLDWLWHKLSDVDWVPGAVSSTALPDTDVVVNATGLGARDLVGDTSLSPVRGEVVVVRQWGLTEWVLDETDEANPCYVVPRSDTVVLGGTARPGDERTEADPDTARSIVDRCAALVPESAAATVVRHVAGLRPARPTVRLETEPGDPPAVHCYGHGGAGVTLAYGCAEEVAAMVEHAVDNPG